MAAQKKGSKPAPKQTAAKKKPAQKPAQAAKEYKTAKASEQAATVKFHDSSERKREQTLLVLHTFLFGILELLITFVEGMACGNGSMS